MIPRFRIHPIAKLLIILLMFDSLACLAWSGYVLNATEHYGKQDRFDVVVVLMGDFNEDYSDLGEETRRRLNFAVSLLDRYRVNAFLCLGGSRPRSHIIGADLMKSYLEAQGIPPQRVLADGKSFDTFGNWRDAVARIEDNRWRNVGIISSAFHLYRLERYIIDHREGLNISLLPFSYRNTAPRISLLELWESVHYEWITAIVYSLPRPVYEWIVSLLRPQ